MKTKIFALVLAVLLTSLVFCACTKEIPEENNGPVMPEGDITEIWFEDTIKAFYPKTLGNMFFTKIYLYGEVETDQPAIFLCSEKLTEISLLSLSDGVVGEALYTVDELNPMEALVLQEELSKTPEFAISFKNENGANFVYTIEKDGDDILLEEVK